MTEPDFSSENNFVARIYIRYLVPGFIALAFGQLAPFVDALVVARKMGEDGMSAIGVIFPIYYAFNFIAMLFGIGGGLRMSTLNGAGKRLAAQQCFSAVTALLMLVSLAAGAAVFLFDDAIAALCSTASLYREPAAAYLKILSTGVPAYLLSFAFFFFLTHDNSPQLAMAGMCLSNVVNIGLDILFVLYFDWGVVGAAWATVIGLYAELALYGLHFLKKDRLMKWRRWNIGVSWWITLFPGLPDSASALLKGVRIWLLNCLLFRLGGASAVADGILMNNLLLLILLITSGLADPVAPMAGFFMGENNRRNLNLLLSIAEHGALWIGGAVAAFLLLYPQSFTSLFQITDPELLAMAPVGIRCIAVSVLFAAINNILIQFLLSTGRSSLALEASFLRELLIIACAFPLGFRDGGGWLFMAYPLSELLTLGWLVWSQKQSVRIRLTDRENTLWADGGLPTPDAAARWASGFAECAGCSPDWVREKVLAPLLQQTKTIFFLSILQKKNGRVAVIRARNHRMSKNMPEGMKFVCGHCRRVIPLPAEKK